MTVVPLVVGIDPCIGNCGCSVETASYGAADVNQKREACGFMDSVTGMQ